MYQTRIVPWVNYQEFETVYHWLFADRKTQVDQVRRGIDRVQTWTNRGEIPSSVETTAALIEIIIHDEQSSHLSHKELRLTYAMALVRFVNGLVDREQKGKFAKSIQVLARSIGLPSWFVDLRHASTHEHLPSLMVLRDGAMQAVAWLHDNYWVRNLKKADQQNHDEIKSKLNQYKECRKSFMKEKYSANSSDPDAYVACIQQLIEVIGYQEEQLQQDVIPLLLNVGGLVPTGKKKRASPEEMQISKGLIELWTPLIQGLDVGFPDFGRQLVKAIIKRLNINEEFKVNETLLNPYAAFATKEKADDPTQTPSYLLTLSSLLAKAFCARIQSTSKAAYINSFDYGRHFRCISSPPQLLYSLCSSHGCYSRY
ncbi:Las1-like-domain-containing protein [Choanephora cucurbitarum]|nr:Las1-like-domain-containing protein [Choanephora cucurbitarum]